MKRAADDLGVGLFEVMTFVDPPAGVCNFVGNRGRRGGYRLIVRVAFGIR